jgi:hypothetical protein
VGLRWKAEMGWRDETPWKSQRVSRSDVHHRKLPVLEGRHGTTGRIEVHQMCQACVQGAAGIHDVSRQAASLDIRDATEKHLHGCSRLKIGSWKSN